MCSILAILSDLWRVFTYCLILVTLIVSHALILADEDFSDEDFEDDYLYEKRLEEKEIEKIETEQTHFCFSRYSFP